MKTKSMARVGLICILVSMFSQIISAEDGITDTEIKLGCDAPLSGPAAFYSTIIDGMKSHFNRINKEGGVNGRKINFICLDNETSPNKALEAAKKLVQQEKVAAFVSSCSNGHDGAVKFLRQHKTPDIFPFTNTDWVFSPPDPNTVYFGYSNSEEGQHLADMVNKLFANKKIAVLGVDVSIGTEVDKSFRKNLSPNVNVVYDETVPVTQQSFQPQVSKIKSSGAEVLLILNNLPQVITTVKEAAQLNFKPQFLVVSYNMDETLAGLGGPEAEGTMGTNCWGRDAGTDAENKEIEKDLQAYDKDMEVNPLTKGGWLIASIVVKAIKNAGKDLTRVKLVKSFEELDGSRVPFAYNPLKFNKTTRSLVPECPIQIIKDRKIVKYVAKGKK